MKFTARKKYVFHPNYGDNLKLPESERLSVEIIRPTAEMRGDIQYAELASVEGTTAVRMKFLTSPILRRCVGEIKNLEVEDFDAPGKTRAIKTGEELAAESFYGMGALVDLICAEVCSDIITDTQKKISESGSGSSGTDGTNGNPGPNTRTEK